jgi:hypothetical protein
MRKSSRRIARNKRSGKRVKYGGTDKSIMDAINVLSQNKDFEYCLASFAYLDNIISSSTSLYDFNSNLDKLLTYVSIETIKNSSLIRILLGNAFTKLFKNEVLTYISTNQYTEFLRSLFAKYGDLISADIFQNILERHDSIETKLILCEDYLRSNAEQLDAYYYCFTVHVDKGFMILEKMFLLRPVTKELLNEIVMEVLFGEFDFNDINNRYWKSYIDVIVKIAKKSGLGEFIASSVQEYCDKMTQETGEVFEDDVYVDYMLEKLGITKTLKLLKRGIHESRFKNKTKEFDWENVCSNMESISNHELKYSTNSNIETLRKVARLFNINFNDNTSKKELCNALNQTFYHNLPRECNNLSDQTNFTGDLLISLPSYRIVRFRKRCYDIMDLYELSKRKKDEYNVPMTSEELLYIKDIIDKYNSIRTPKRLTGPSLYENVLENPIFSSRQYLNQQIQELFSFIPYPPDISVITESTDKRINRMLLSANGIYGKLLTSADVSKIKNLKGTDKKLALVFALRSNLESVLQQNDPAEIANKKVALQEFFSDALNPTVNEE